MKHQVQVVWLAFCIAGTSCGASGANATTPGASAHPADVREQTRATQALNGSHTIAAAGRNQAVEQRVDSYEVTPSFDGTPAAPGHAFVVLSLRWTNILEAGQVSDAAQNPDSTLGAGGLGAGAAPARTADGGQMHTAFVPYVIPNVSEHLHLIVNGEAGAPLVNSNFKSKDLLTSGVLTIAHGADVVGRAVFDVRAPIDSLELDYFDSVHGNIRIPIAGPASAPSRSAAIAGPATSGGFVTSVTAVQEVAAIGDHKPRRGDCLVAVSLLGQGAPGVGDNFLEIKPAEISRLVENSGYVYSPTDIDDVEGVWSDVVRFVPGSPSRGQLVFEVPVPHAPLTLSIMVPGEAAPVRLPLSAAAAGPSPGPSAIASVPDGATGAFYLYSSRRARTYGDQTAEAGQEFLVLDVGVENRTGSGLEFQTKEQVGLLNGTNEIQAIDDDLAATARALPEGGVVPAHTLGRYEIPFRVPAATSSVTINYHGFENDKKIPLGGGQ